MSVADRDPGRDRSQDDGEELVAIVDDSSEDAAVCTIAPAVAADDDERMTRWISAEGDDFVDVEEMR